jgi:hypothetical protein
LLGYLKNYPNIRHLPNGLHTVVPADLSKGLEPGVIFALRNRHHSVNIQQQNRLHPYYLIYMADSGEVAINHLQAKPLLDSIRAACKGREQADEVTSQHFNRLTQDGRNMSHYSGLLDEAIHAMVAVKAQSDIDSLFSGGPTTALNNDIAGLDQFELINFIVVQAMADAGTTEKMAS